MKGGCTHIYIIGSYNDYDLVIFRLNLSFSCPLFSILFFNGPSLVLRLHVELAIKSSLNQIHSRVASKISWLVLCWMMEFQYTDSCVLVEIPFCCASSTSWNLANLGSIEYRDFEKSETAEAIRHATTWRKNFGTHHAQWVLFMKLVSQNYHNLQYHKYFHLICSNAAPHVIRLQNSNSGLEEVVNGMWFFR